MLGGMLQTRGFPQCVVVRVPIPVLGGLLTFDITRIYGSTRPLVLTSSWNPQARIIIYQFLAISRVSSYCRADWEPTPRYGLLSVSIELGGLSIGCETTHVWRCIT